MNIPTPVEALKTYDNKVFHKSGDIGQILQVFRDEDECEKMRSQLVTETHDLYYPDGLTAPTEDIVHRRFDSTRTNEDCLTFRYQEVLADVLDFSIRSGGNMIPSTRKMIETSKSRKQQQSSNIDNDENADNGDEKLPYYETIIEEVLDFDEYMIDVMNPGHGRTLVFDGDWTEEQIELVASHPEIIWSKLEEEEDALDQQYLRTIKSKLLSGNAQSSSKSVSLISSSNQAESTTGSLSLKFSIQQNAEHGIGAAVNTEEIDGNLKTSSSMNVDGEEEPTPVVKKIDSSRAAAMLSMLLEDDDGEDAEEGEGEQDEAAEEAEEVVVVAGEDDAEGEDENMEEDDWMEDL